MESNWRWNVFLYFGTDSGIALCARLLAPLHQFLIVHRAHTSPWMGEYWYLPPLGGLPLFFGYQYYPVATRHFPWTELVEPDR